MYQEVNPKFSSLDYFPLTCRAPLLHKIKLSFLRVLPGNYHSALYTSSPQAHSFTSYHLTHALSLPHTPDLLSPRIYTWSPTRRRSEHPRLPDSCFCEQSFATALLTNFGSPLLPPAPSASSADLIDIDSPKSSLFHKKRMCAHESMVLIL